MNPFIQLLDTLINLFSLALLVWIILSWLIAFNIVNRHQPFVYKLNEVLSRLIEPVLRPIRRILPDLGGIDISPILLIILLQFIQNSLYYYL